MSLFKKKTPPVNDLTSVIKNGGAAGLLIWRHPEECFSVDCTLTVMPGEQAVFIKHGEILQTFLSGSYKLSSEKYSFIQRILNKITGKSAGTFNCVVYFVNAADTRELRWGTQTPIQVRDKVYDIRTDVKARGAYKIRITDPAMFLKRFVGSNVNFRDDEAFEDWFAFEFQGKIKSAVSKLLNSLDRELIGIDEYLDELSERIKPRMDEIVYEYGLACVSFAVSGMDVDISKYDVIDRSQIASVATVKKARGDRGAMDILGDGWEKQQSADILRTLVDKTPADGIGAIGTGIGMGAAAGGLINGLAKSITPGGGNEHDDEAPDPTEKLEKLKKLYNAGLISEDEYKAKKAEVLDKL